MSSNKKAPHSHQDKPKIVFKIKSYSINANPLKRSTKPLKPFIKDYKNLSKYNLDDLEYYINKIDDVNDGWNFNRTMASIVLEMLAEDSRRRKTS